MVTMATPFDSSGTLGMLLGIALAGALYATTLGHLWEGGESAVLQAAGTGFMVASISAAIGAVTSATRPRAPKREASAG